MALGEERPLSSLLRARTALVMGLFVLATAALLFVAENVQSYRWESVKLSDGLEEAYSSSLGNINNLSYAICQGILEGSDYVEDSFETDEFLNNAANLTGVDAFMLLDSDGHCVYSSQDVLLGNNADGNEKDSDLVGDIFRKVKNGQNFNYLTFINEHPEYLTDGEMNYYGYYVREDHRLSDAGSVLMAGLTETAFNQLLTSRLCIFARNALMGQTGGFLVLKEIEGRSGEYYVCGGKNIVPYMYKRNDGDIDTIAFPAAEHEEGKAFYHTFPTGRYLCMYRHMTDVICVAMIPKAELNRLIFRNILYAAILLAILVLFMNIVLHRMLNKVVVAPLHDMTETMDTISTGSLDTQMNVRDNLEFSVLSDGINRMVLTLKQYIKDAEERIDRELAIARSIQLSSVPNIFPAFSNRSDFDIYASMETAKEVGGDFYDYFLLDPDHLAIVMADVSDKGIPAAMFMMRAKAKIHDRARRGGTPAQILYDSNNSLCKNNKERLFVTVWLAIIDLSTGRGLEANAGHEHPAFYKNECYRLVKYPHSPPIAGVPNLPYTDREFILHPGDKIFVYTDGITDAINKENKRFGEDALVTALNELADKDPKATIDGISQKVNSFSEGATQFDDITMCAFIYYGNRDNLNKEGSNDSK